MLSDWHAVAVELVVFVVAALARAELREAFDEFDGPNLASQASVRAAAGQIAAAHKNINLLINNAVVMGIPETKTVDGFEMQFGVDHLGLWTLTALLLPALLRTADARQPAANGRNRPSTAARTGGRPEVTAPGALDSVY